MTVGDWVQAIERITEENFAGKALHVHAETGGVGHVLNVESDGWVNVWFERSGTITICHESELRWLCAYSGPAISR